MTTKDCGDLKDYLVRLNVFIDSICGKAYKQLTYSKENT